jgi:hypothetical protein
MTSCFRFASVPLICCSFFSICGCFSQLM